MSHPRVVPCPICGQDKWEDMTGQNRPCAPCVALQEGGVPKLAEWALGDDRTYINTDPDPEIARCTVCGCGLTFAQARTHQCI